MSDIEMNLRKLLEEIEELSSLDEIAGPAKSNHDDGQAVQKKTIDCEHCGKTHEIETDMSVIVSLINEFVDQQWDHLQKWSESKGGVSSLVLLITIGQVAHRLIAATLEAAKRDNILRFPTDVVMLLEETGGVIIDAMGSPPATPEGPFIGFWEKIEKTLIEAHKGLDY